MLFVADRSMSIRRLFVLVRLVVVPNVRILE
jgi:hypothetical protein